MFTVTLSNDSCKIKIVSVHKEEAELGDITKLRIKRKEAGDLIWTLIKEIPIESITDFDFTFYDKYTCSRRMYTYQFVPTEGESAELEPVEASIECNFDSIYIADNVTEYILDLDLDYSLTRNKPVAYVNPINTVHPIAVFNSASNYTTGKVTALPLPVDSNGRYTTVGAQKYKEDFMNFLVNEKPKLLKIYDGHSFIVNINDAPREEVSKFEGATKISFDFTETDFFPSSDS